MTAESDIVSERIASKVTLDLDKSCYCWRCGYEWTSRKKTVPPANCPRCRSDKWHVYRIFVCQECEYAFASHNLSTPPYQLFPTCPRCNSSTWHKQLEELIVRQEKEKGKPEDSSRRVEGFRRHPLRLRQEKGEEKLEVYLRRVEAFRRHPLIIILWFFILVIAFSIFIFAYGASTDEELQLNSDTRAILVYIIGFCSLIFLLSFQIPKQKFLNKYQLNQLLRRNLITNQEAEWIRKQFPDYIAQKSNLTVLSSRQSHNSRSGSTIRNLIGTITAFVFLVLFGIIFVTWKIFFVTWKIFIGALRFLIKGPTLMLFSFLLFHLD